MSLLYYFSSIIVILIVVHWIHGVFIFNEDSNPFHRVFNTPGNYTPFPYIMFKGDPNSSFYNSIGYQGPIPSENKDDTFRIFVLGGSAVALGSPPFSSIMEEIFHKEGHNKVRIFNFGAVSSMLGQDIARIIYEVVDFHPNLVVMYSGFNDLEHGFYADPRPGYPFNFIIHENNPLSSTSLKSFPWALLLYKSSILRQLFPDFFLKRFTNIEALRLKVDYGSEKWKKQTVDAYWNYIGKAKKIADAYGFNLLIVFQAVLYGKKLHANEKPHISNWSDRWKMLFNYLINSPHRDKDISFFDRSGMFSHIKEQVFVDRVHIKQEYKPSVARELFKIITESDSYFEKN